MIFLPDNLNLYGFSLFAHDHTHFRHVKGFIPKCKTKPIKTLYILTNWIIKIKKLFNTKKKLKKNKMYGLGCGLGLGYANCGYGLGLGYGCGLDYASYGCGLGYASYSCGLGYSTYGCGLLC